MIHNIIKFCVDNLGDTFCLMVGLIIAMGPYIYELVQGFIARSKYTKEDIQNMINDEIEKDGSESKFFFYFIIMTIIKLAIVFGSFAIGCYIMDQVNDITFDYIEQHLSDSMKHWPWD